MESLGKSAVNGYVSGYHILRSELFDIPINHYHQIQGFWVEYNNARFRYSWYKLPTTLTVALQFLQNYSREKIVH